LATVRRDLSGHQIAGRVESPAGWAAPVKGRAVTVMAELLAAAAGGWDRDSGRWFAFVLLACALVCFKRL
jgi:hypothetical protein